MLFSTLAHYLIINYIDGIYRRYYFKFFFFFFIEPLLLHFYYRLTTLLYSRKKRGELTHDNTSEHDRVENLFIPFWFPLEKKIMTTWDGTRSIRVSEQEMAPI